MKHPRRCWKYEFLKKGYFSSGKNLLTFFARVSEHEKSLRLFYKGPGYLLTFFVQVTRSFLKDLGAKFKIIPVRLNSLLKRNVCGKSYFSIGKFFQPKFSRIICDAVENTKIWQKAIFPFKKFRPSCNIE